MTRITPRTCLWPLAASLSLTFALSIGLTFRSNHHCYAGTCGEWLFPLQARLHVVVWYCWLAISVTVLAIRAFHPLMQKLLQRALFQRKLPLLGKQLAVGGVFILFWILSLYGIIIGIWWVRLRDYFSQRGIEGGLLAGNGRLAAIALTGHLCDVTMGMAIMPISRHSALASFFKISVATTLTFHMITAYTLFALVLTHGLLYVAWIPVFENLPDALRHVYPVLNPTYLYHEVWPGSQSDLGVWRASLIFTGLSSAFIMLLIFVTTLPAVRNRHFNIFYFTHLVGIVAIIIICLHASTMLYCTAPGLAMWVLDWMMRLYELWAPLDGKITALGKGWYSLSVPLPRRRLDGCACTSPLAHFYIHHSDSSTRELHPFTTITHLASQNAITHPKEDDITVRFLFRKRGISYSPASIPVIEDAKHGFAPAVFGLLRKLGKKKSQSQWTDRLAGFANEEKEDERRNEGELALMKKRESKMSRYYRDVAVLLRLEGPYFTPAHPAMYQTVVCLVAGTGISGAMAISGAFREMERQSSIVSTNEMVASSRLSMGNGEGQGQGQVEVGHQHSREDSISSVRKGNVWTRCIVIWSVREDTYIDIPELKSPSASGLDVRVHLTGNGRPRLSAKDALDEILDEDEKTSSGGSAGKMWVYISGPNAFIAAGEEACKERQQRGVEWYGAKWDI